MIDVLWIRLMRSGQLVLRLKDSISCPDLAALDPNAELLYS